MNNYNKLISLQTIRINLIKQIKIISQFFKILTILNISKQASNN